MNLLCLILDGLNFESLWIVIGFEGRREVHSQALKLGFSSNWLLKLSITELQGKCRELGNSQRMFDAVPEDIVSIVTNPSFIDQGLVA